MAINLPLISGTKYPMIILNTTLGIVLQLIPNPNHFRFESSKIFSKTQTLEGFVFEHWGESPSMIHVTGHTVGMYHDAGDAAAEAFMFALRQIYRVDKKRVAALTSLVKSSATNLYGKITGKSGTATTDDYTQLSNTFIYYRYDAYTGFFTEFEYEQTAERPNLYRYDFKFLVTGTAQNFLADMLFTPSTSSTKTIIGAVAGAALLTGAGIAANSLVDNQFVG